MSEKDDILKNIGSAEYKHGFETQVEQEFIPKGLNEDIIRLISEKKEEPQWLLDFRLKAYRKWLTMKMPAWAHLDIPEIDFQDIIYFAAPKKAPEKKEIDPELMATFDKLGIPLHERSVLAGTAVDAVFDSVSVKTTFRESLAEKGIIFCSFSEAVRDYPDLVRKYLASVVPIGAASSPIRTIFTPLSTPPFSPTGRSATSPREYTARWSFPATSGSMPGARGSSSAPSSWPTKAPT